jgi:hypothetical protein
VAILLKLSTVCHHEQGGRPNRTRTDLVREALDVLKSAMEYQVFS